MPATMLLCPQYHYRLSTFVQIIRTQSTINAVFAPKKKQGQKLFTKISGLLISVPYTCIRYDNIYKIDSVKIMYLEF